MLDEAPKDLMKGSCASPAANHLFSVNDSCNKLDSATAILYHHLTAQLLYLGKRTRPDLLLAIYFLCNRVQEPDEDDWKKLGRCLRFLRETKDDHLTLEADGNNVIIWWIDASYAVHPNMRSHTGATMSMGKGCPISISTKQKINTRSSTEAEIVGVNDAMYLVMWVRHFLESQGYNIKDNIVYQDNKSSIKLEQNGKTSSTKNTRHMEIRYFFVTDNIQRNKLSVKYCPTEIMLGDYYTKPQQGSRMRRSRASILNLKQDPTLVSQECVESRRPSDGRRTDTSLGNVRNSTSLGNVHNSTSLENMHNYGRRNDASPENVQDEWVTRRAASYLMAAKGLLRKVNNKVNRLDSLYSINLK